MSMQDQLTPAPTPGDDPFDPHAQLPVQADYFSFGETFQCFFGEKYGDTVSYVEHKSLNEGSRRRYLNSVNREVTLERQSGNARMKLASGDEKHLLLEEAIVGWNLIKDGKPVTFSKGSNGSTLSQFLAMADPAVIDVIEKDVRKNNAWLLAEVTVDGIKEQIKDLEEMLEEKIKEESGNDTSSAK